MKFNFTPENTKRLTLSGLVLIVLVYVFYSFLLGPAFKSITTGKQRIAALDKSIATANSAINRVSNMRAQLNGFADLETTLFANQPGGDPIAWFPPRVENFFKKAGIPRCLATLSAPSETEIPGFRTYRCTIQFPSVSFMQFGAALAAFENHDNLIEVRSISIDAQADNPGLQLIAVEVRVILKG